MGENPEFDDEKNISDVLDDLCSLYRHKLLPFEHKFKFHELIFPRIEEAEFFGLPMVMFLGNYSTGKTSFIKFILGEEYPECRIGPEPTTEGFVAIMYGPHSQHLPGSIVAFDSKRPFGAFGQFGNGFLNRFCCSELNNEVCKSITFIDTPGILSGAKNNVNRNYPFIDVVKSFAIKCDRIFIMFDAHKLDISDELQTTLRALKYQENKIRIILNKADQVNKQGLIRVHGALMWGLGKFIETPEVIRVYLGSFWNKPYLFDDYKDLFDLEMKDLIKDLMHLPLNSTMRKCDDLIYRTRLSLINANIISEISKLTPSLFFTERKKIKIIGYLPMIYKKLQKSLNIPLSDFPKIEEYMTKLSLLDFTKFPTLKSRQIEQIENILTLKIPNLIDKINLELQNERERTPIKGGIFEWLASKSNIEVKDPFFNKNNIDDSLNKEHEPWIVENLKPKYNEIFENLREDDIKIGESVIWNYFKDSKLSNTTLNKIWSFSDIDKDGYLDIDEFSLFLYLVDRNLNGAEMPDILPINFIPLSKRNN